jgi:alcohol dehydrogenase (cytochrome c)
MKNLGVLGSLCIFLLTAALFGKSPTSVSELSKPAVNAWATYHGDFSGRHFSTLKQIDTTNVKGLSLAWIYRVNTSTEGAIVSGTPLPPGTPRRGGGWGATIKSVPLAVDGVLYFSTPGNAYAVDARTGKEIWHYVWQGRGAIGNRGMGMYNDWLYLETPDNNIVSIEAKTGKERWHKPLAPDRAANFSTSAPVVIRNHVILGVGGDSGRNATWVESRDPDTGELQWRWYVTPSKGEPGLDTWPNEHASSLGGGGPWQPITYDPELNLIYVTTGNPTPSYNGLGREGINLYTCSVVALNPDSGKMAWYYQFSPHDTHDWDSTETPVLIDDVVDGKPRKLLATAQRNGFYFLLDRITGKNIVVKQFLPLANGYKGVDANGVLIPEKDKEPSLGGVLIAPTSDGATNYPAPSYDPNTGLFYFNATAAHSIFYLPPDATQPTGFGRGIEYHGGLYASELQAIDYKTGAVKWKHEYPQIVGFPNSTFPGMLSTEGGILFAGDPSGNFIAYDATTGKSLWHAPLGSLISNNPETFMMDGKQYVIVGSGENLFAFYLQ